VADYRQGPGRHRIEHGRDGHHGQRELLKDVGYTLDEVTGQHHRMFCDAAYINGPEYQAFWAKLNRGKYDARIY